MMLNEHSSNFHLSDVKIVDVVKTVIIYIETVHLYTQIDKNLINYFFCMQLFQNWTI